MEIDLQYNRDRQAYLSCQKARELCRELSEAEAQLECRDNLDEKTRESMTAEGIAVEGILACAGRKPDGSCGAYIKIMPGQPN